MKKLTLLALIFTIAIGFNACKKDEETNPADNGGNTEPKEEIIEIKTSFGTMYMWLYKETPKHRDNFLKLAKQGYFDGTTFHRIVTNFVIQGGDPNSKDSDPNNDGQGGPGYLIDAEILSSLKHEYGAIGAARTNNPAKASSGSQFYVVVNKNGTPNLDGNYTVFGKVFKGMEAADEIVKQPNSGSPNNRPTTDIKMEVKVIEKTEAELKSEFDFEIPK